MTWVYFMRALGKERIKVGVTTDIERTVRQHLTYWKAGLEVIGMVRCSRESFACQLRDRFLRGTRLEDTMRRSRKDGCGPDKWVKETDHVLRRMKWMVDGFQDCDTATISEEKLVSIRDSLTPEVFDAVMDAIGMDIPYGRALLRHMFGGCVGAVCGHLREPYRRTRVIPEVQIAYSEERGSHTARQS